MEERIDMINGVTGTLMSVPVHLVERYRAAGHKLAAAPLEEDKAEASKNPRATRAKK